ncbi:MAG: hypothetical protein R3B13_38165 [Polyangiaceae bacterium]
MKRLIQASFVALVLCGAPAAHAQSDAAKVAAARQIGFDGIKDYQAGKFAEASDKLERAYALVKAPTLGLWSARALVKVGRWVAASERFLETTRLPLPDSNQENHRRAQEDAAKERAALLPTIPTLQVDVAGAAAGQVELAMDGVAIDSALIGVARPVDPGERTVVAKFGGQERQRRLTLAANDKKTITLSFDAAATPVTPTPSTTPVTAPPTSAPPTRTPPPASAPPTADSGAGGSNTLAYVALGVGGAGLIAGGVLGVMAMSKRSEIEDSGFCDGDRCAPEVHEDIDALDNLRLFSTVGIVIGVVGVGAGVTLLATGGSEAAPSTALTVGPGSLQLKGRF